jgi:hypothetical protein
MIAANPTYKRGSRMKTLIGIVILPMMLTASLSFGQGLGLQKGNLFGVHVITVNLRPHVTLDEFAAFFVSHVIPEYEKQWTGLRGYLVRSVRGEYKNSLAIVWVFKTEAARNRYFTADDKPNELEKAAFERVKPIEEELKQYGTYTVKYMDDWVVQ